MKAVQTFWTKPAQTQNSGRLSGGFPSERYLWYSIALSSLLAKKQLGKVSLVTDTAGASTVRTLKLPYDSIDCLLDSYTDIPVEFWNVGKFITYAAQHEPFIHIDLDCYLWQPLPNKMINGEIIAQSIECTTEEREFYRVALRRMQRVGIPVSDWFGTDVSEPAAINCGIFGGNNLEVIHSYADRSLALLTNAAHRVHWEALRASASGAAALWHCAVTIEQLGLAACCHTRALSPIVLHPGILSLDLSDFQNIDLTHLVHMQKCNQTKLRQLTTKLTEASPELRDRIDKLFP